MAKLGRNDACWCGSGKKFKKCHFPTEPPSQPAVHRSRPAAATADAGSRGQITSWFQQLIGDVYRNRERLTPEFAWSAAYSYGVALSMNGDFERAIAAFTELRKARPLTDFHTSKVAEELCYAYYRVDDFDSALFEADLALDLGRRCERLSIVPLMYRGRMRAIERLKEGKTDLLEALQLALEARDVVNAGRIAQDLSRLDRGRPWPSNHEPESLVWSQLASECFKQFSPTLLSSSASAGFDSLAGPMPADRLTPEQFEFRELITWCRQHSEVRFISLLDMDLFGHMFALHMRHVSNEFPGHSTQHLMKVPLALNEGRKLASILMDELEHAIRQPGDFAIVANTSLAATLGLSHVASPALETCRRENIEVKVTAGDEPGTTEILWSSKEAWPWTFAAILNVLGYYYSSSILLVRAGRDRSKRSETPLLENHPRALLTRIAGYGEMEAGAAVSVTHLCFLQLHRLLIEEQANLDKLRSIGFEPEEARDLAGSGLLALDKLDVEHWRAQSEVETVTLTVREHGVQHIGQMPVTPEQLLPGILVDKFYRAEFMARRLVAGPVYGSTAEEFPPYIATRIQPIPVVGSLRCRRFEVPVVEASSLDELRAICALFSDLKPAPVFFRGQSAQHTLARKPRISKFLYGAEETEEPSLLGSATRQGLDYSVIHPLLQVTIQDKLYETASRSGAADLPAFHRVHEQWLELFRHLPTFPDAAFGPSAWECACMAFAQHYGVPTHGLDITSSVDVAAWFATNVFTPVGDGAAYVARRPDQWPSDKARYPVVYVVLPLIDSLMASIWNIPTLERLGLPALRPVRQQASFFMGAGVIHQNRLAEALVCAIRLAPGDWDTGLSFRELFPSRQEDPGYDFMLRLKERYTQAPYNVFLQSIPTYV